MRQFSKVLDLLQEESAELIVAISKIKRFGSDSINPLIPNSPTNLQNLIQEIGDVQALIDVLLNDTVIEITEEQLVKAKSIKLKKLETFLPIVW